MTRELTTHSHAVNEALVILIPLFNDWVALDKLLVLLDRTLDENGLAAGVLIVNDGSTEEPGDGFARQVFRALRQIDVLDLRRNLGHQRAIALGLAFAEDKGSCETLVIMDSDGEDDPRDIPRLLAKYRQQGGNQIVFAERARRTESLLFRMFYVLYKSFHFWLTGYRVRVGNFSAIPRSRLASLVVVSDLWNHYAAAVFKSRQPYCTLPTSRAKRLHGQSKMNFVGLVIHGLSAISVYSEIVGVRLLLVCVALILLSLFGVACTVYVRLTTNLGIPGWATSTVGILLVILFQAVMLSFIFSFVILAGRQGSSFLPLRDYPYFIFRVRPLCRER